MKLRLVWVLLVAACGSSSGGDDDAGPGGDGGVDVDGGGGGCGAAVCSATHCGTVTDACGEEVACDLCRYDLEPIADGFGRVALWIGDGVDLAYTGPDQDKVVGTRGTPWTADPVAGTIGGDVFDLVRTADGTPWLLLALGQLQVAHGSGGVWTFDTISTGAQTGALAIGADGDLRVVFGGQNPSDGTHGVIVARHSGTTWTYQTAAVTNGVSDYLDLTMHGNDPWIAWTDDVAGTLSFTEPDGSGGFTTTVVDPALPGYTDHHLAIAIDTGDRPLIAYRHDSPFDRAIGTAERDGSTWTLGFAAVYKFGDGDVRMAVSSTGEVAVAFIQNLGPQIATRTGGIWAVQTIASELCAYGDGHVDVGFEGTTLDVVRSCDYQGGLALIRRNGETYPSDYLATCTQAATDLCHKACECSGNGDCCIGGSCSGPETFCVQLTASDVCGDPTQDPALVTGCDDAVDPATLTCTTDPQPGVGVPAACPFPF